MKQVLFLTDFSETARNSIIYGIEMFNNNAQFYILNSYNIETPSSPYIMQIVEDLKLESERGLQKEISLIKNKYPKISIKPLSIYGSLVEAINKIIDNENIELIVLGCRGETIIENIFLGSNAFNVVKYINTPLLVVPKNAVYIGYNKITFASNFMTLDDGIFNTLKKIIELDYSEIILANVGKDKDIFSSDAKKYYRSLLKSSNITFCLIDESDIHKEILKSSKDVDLLILIRNNYNFIERFFKPSLTKKMVMRSQKPMLIFHN